jgi:hypothetical protein
MPQFGVSSITILEASFSLIHDVYSTGITYDDHNRFVVQATWPGVIKLFTIVCYECSLLARFFFSSSPFKHCLMFASEAGACLSEALFRLWGKRLALSTNIRLGWIRVEVTQHNRTKTFTIVNKLRP